MTVVGVDVGGTFTDLAAIVDGRLVVAKVPSTPADQSAGVADVLRAAALVGPIALAHGMTVATNALLERRGARTALVTTEGFADLIEIARQDRASVYDLSVRRPEPLVPRDLRFVVRERVSAHGVPRATTVLAKMSIFLAHATRARLCPFPAAVSRWYRSISCGFQRKDAASEAV